MRGGPRRDRRRDCRGQLSAWRLAISPICALNWLADVSSNLLRRGTEILPRLPFYRARVFELAKYCAMKAQVPVGEEVAAMLDEGFKV